MKFLISFIFILTSCISFAGSSNVKCVSTDKLAIIYLNGVNNEVEDAEESVERLQTILMGRRDELSSVVGSSGICYGFVYNQTEGYLDLVEALAQSIRQESQTRKLGMSEDQIYHATLLTIMTASSILSAKFPILAPTLGLLFNKAQVEHVKNSEGQTMNAEIMPHLVSTLRSNNLNKVALVSHSQGNLFANQVTSRLSSYYDINKSKFSNLQVASAASANKSNQGFYLTSTSDWIRVLPTSLGANIDISPTHSTRDTSFGHSFVDIYTSSSISGEHPLESGNVKAASEHFLDKLIQLITGASPHVSANAIDYDGMNVKLEINYSSFLGGRELEIIDQDTSEVISTIKLEGGELSTDGRTRKMTVNMLSSYNARLISFTGLSKNVSIPKIEVVTDESGVTRRWISNRSIAYAEHIWTYKLTYTNSSGIDYLHTLDKRNVGDIDSNRVAKCGVVYAGQDEYTSLSGFFIPGVNWVKDVEVSGEIEFNLYIGGVKIDTNFAPLKPVVVGCP